MIDTNGATQKSPRSYIDWILPIGALLLITFAAAPMVSQHFEMKKLHDELCANYEKAKSRFHNQPASEFDPEQIASDQMFLQSTKATCDLLPPW